MQLLLISDELLKALCWTLIHSLWQGIIAAAIAGLIIVLTKRSTGQLRYNLLGGLMLLFIGGSIATFFLLLNGFATPPVETSVYTISDSPTIQVANLTTGIGHISMIEQMNDWLNTHATLLVTWWVAFFMLNCIRLLAGVGSVNRLRAYRTRTAPEYWQTRVHELSTTLGIKKGIDLLQSGLVKVPVTVGIFKPVILLPAGLLMQLPTDQVETILLHELAHIRRKDYLVNLVQRFAEAIYFFNPALLWISSLMRQEREACCDDIVMAHTNGHSYLEALVSFQELNLPAGSYAMSISTKRTYLLNRVKRMLTRENIKLNFMEKVFLSASLAVLMAFTILPKEKEETPTTAVANKPATHELKVMVVDNSTKPILQVVKTPVKKKTEKKIIPIPIQDTDTIRKRKNINYDTLNFKEVSVNSNDDGKTRKETISATDENGKKYMMTRVNDQLTSLNIDGKEIPASEYANHGSLLANFDRMRAARKEALQRQMEVRKQQQIERQAQREAQETLRRAQADRREVDNKRRQVEQQARQQREEVARMNKKMSGQLEQQRKDLDRDNERRKIEMKKINERYKVQEEKFRKDQEIYREKQQELRQKQREYERKVNNTTQNNIEYKKPLEKAYAKTFTSYTASEPMKAARLEYKKAELQYKSAQTLEPMKPMKGTGYKTKTVI